jgi:translocation and assembly module TamA
MHPCVPAHGRGLFLQKRGYGKAAALAAILGTASAGVAQPADPLLEDPAFEASLPPLEPIGPAPPAESLTVPDATPADPELARPLPPIATFDATPPPAIAVEDEAASNLRYTVQVVGLKDIDLEARFRELSALVEGGKKAANAAQVSARADEDVKLIERLLRSEGYYDGIVTSVIDPLPDQPGRAAVTLTAAPGARYTLGTIAVTGPETVPPRLAYDALDLRTGAPIVAAVIETAEANVALRLPEQGYPFVAVGARDVLLDEATHIGDYTLPVDTGPRSTFGGFQVAGDPVFGAKHVDLLARFKPGQLYDSRKVDDLRQALIATSLFSTVSVEPVRTQVAGPDGTEAVDLLVRQSKGPWRSLAGSAGYGTGEGIKVQGSWTHRNLFPDEGALSLGAIAGTQQQGVNATFRRSNAGLRDRTFQLGADVARQDFAAYNAQTVTLSGSLSRQSTPIWQKRWTYSVGGEIIATRESRFATELTARNKSTYFIAAVPLQLGYDASDSLLDPAKGFRVTARLSPEAQKRSGGGFDNYVRTLVEGSAYFPVMQSLVLAGRVRAGSIQGVTRDDIAPSRRLYSGGGGSVRGFGYQDLGPKDANGDPLGGRSVNEFAVEARYRFGNFGVVPFVDAGQVYESTAPKFSSLRYGAGIGGRYYTNFGPMRVDVATPLGRRAGDPKIALYFSIGQAF